MTKAAVIALADTETHGDLARVVNAMMTAKEFAEAGDDVISGACAFCSRAFDAEDGVRSPDVRFLEGYEGHPSIRRLVQEG
jgi:hypothetical protein